MPADEPGPPRERVRVRVRLTEGERRARRRRRRRRRALRGVGYAALFLLLVGGWLLFTGLRARSALDAARADLGTARTALSHGDTRAAKAAVSKAGDETSVAKRRTDDLVWRSAAAIPLLGNTFDTVRGVARGAHTMATIALPTALQADKALDPAQARPQPDRIDLDLLIAARAPLATALNSSTRVTADVRNLPSVGYFPAVAHARTDFLTQAADVVQLLRRATTAAELAPPMLGIDGPRRYFLAFQTNAEARGTGGLVGAFAILKADRGRITVERVASDSELLVRRPVPVALSAGYEAAFGDYGTRELWGNTNVSPDFPDVAKIWLSYYQQVHPGVHLDGAFATDPVALSTVLRALGPVRLPSGEQITAANVVRLLEVDTYARYNNDPQRKIFQVEVAQAVLSELLRRGGSPSRLFTAFGSAADDGRILIASAHAAEERRLRETEVGGAVTKLTGPTAYLVINNAAGDKLDYYLRRSLDYTAGSCRGPTRSSTVRIRLTNTAPKSGLPPIVSDRLDLEPGQPFVRGTSRSLVSLVTTAGASYDAATLDGQPVEVSTDEVYGHPFLTTDLEIAPGQTRELVFRLTEPVVTGAAEVPVQPLVDAMRIQVNVPTCRG